MRVNVDEIVRLTLLGASRKEVAERLGINRASVANALRPLGLLDEKKQSRARKGQREKSEQARNRGAISENENI